MLIKIFFNQNWNEPTNLLPQNDEDFDIELTTNEEYEEMIRESENFKEQ